MNWQDWSVHPQWKNQALIPEGSENLDALQNWLSTNRKKPVVPILEAVQQKLKRAAAECGQPQMASRMLKMIEDAIACI